MNWFGVRIAFHFLVFYFSCSLTRFSTKHCCIVGRKEFSRKTEDSKIKSFLGSEFTGNNSCFELKQFFTVLLFSHSGSSLMKT